MPYLITEKTYALIPNGNYTKVIEADRVLNIDEDPKNCVARNCALNCSTLEGRQRGSSYLIGSSYKPPIILNEEKGLILIPTHSIRNKKCNWIVLNNILNYYSHNKMVQIEFANSSKIDISISFNIFDKQVLRATRLESILRGRNKKSL